MRAPAGSAREAGAALLDDELSESGILDPRERAVSPDPLLPDVADPQTAPYWAAARQGQLVMQRCDRCGSWRWTPRGTCPECLEPGGTWAEIDSRGTIWSFAVYHRAFHPSFEAALPYNVALVKLDAGPKVLTNIEAPVEQLKIGLRVRAVFREVTDEVTLVRFALDG
jgi:uncharacterized OB-fold protein